MLGKNRRPWQRFLPRYTSFVQGIDPKLDKLKNWFVLKSGLGAFDIYLIAITFDFDASTTVGMVVVGVFAITLGESNELGP